MVETALTLIYCLGFLFASFQVGLIAYYQISLDAAAELQARYSSLAGLNDGAVAALVNATVPNVQLHAKTRVTLDQNPAKIDEGGIQYGWGSTQQRTGGYSFTVPLPKLAELETDGANLFIGKALGVHLSSFAVGGSVRELCIHSCIGQGGVSASTYANSKDYHSEGDDVMPYFMSFNFMRTCVADPTLDLAQMIPGESTYSWNTCPHMDVNQMATTSINIRALGTAAHLDSTNDFYQGKGEMLNPTYAYGSTIAPAADEAGPFFELWCHRRMYFTIDLQLISNFPTRPVGNAAVKSFLESYVFRRDRSNGFNISPMDFIYSNSPGHPSAGWDAYPLTTDTRYFYDPANEMTPWYGCGVT